MNTKWQKIQNIVKQNLSVNAFKIWLENLEANIIEGDSTCIELKASSAYAAKKLEEEYSHFIIQAAESIGLNNVKLSFTFFDVQKSNPNNSETGNSETDNSGTGKQNVTSQKYSQINLVEPSHFNLKTQNNSAEDKLNPSINKPLPLSAQELEKINQQYSKILLPNNRAFLASSEQLQLPIEQVNFAKFEAKVANSKFQFANFVVGPCNELAHAAARNIINNDQAADMLFLSSGTGLGKTHLVQALGQSIFQQANHKYQRIAYLTAEEFASRFVLAMKQRNLENFKDCFREVDLLILEDVHFLREKEKMQEELHATIRVLQNKGAKVVLTSSFAPNDLQGVDSQLVSRFCSGFVAGINKPDLATRTNIVLEKARCAKVRMPENIASIIAKEISSDIRQLESCLNTIILKAQIAGKPLNEDMAYETLEQFTKLTPNLDMPKIVQLVCKSYEINQTQLSSKSRRQEFVLARNTAFFLARKHTELSLANIGDYFNRKHSTVIKGIEAIEREISRKSPLGFQIIHTLKLIEKQGLRQA